MENKSIMPRVKLEVNRWCYHVLDAYSTDFEEIFISVPEGESILGMVRRLAAENSVFRKAIFDEEHQQIQTNIIVILNGRIVNPHERPEATLKEGDKVMFMPMFYGG